MALDSMQEIFDKAAAGNIPFWRVVLETDMEQRQVTEEQSMEKMRTTWRAMLESVTAYQGGGALPQRPCGRRRREDAAATRGDGERLLRRLPAGGRSPRRCAWGNPTPACARSWRRPRQAPAACCRRC